MAVADDALAVDDIERAFREAVRLAIDAVAPRDLTLRIEVGEEGKTQPPDRGPCPWLYRLSTEMARTSAPRFRNSSHSC